MIFYASSFSKATLQEKGQRVETGDLVGVTLHPVGEHADTKAAMGEHPLGRIELGFVSGKTQLAKDILANKRLRLSFEAV